MVYCCDTFVACTATTFAEAELPFLEDDKDLIDHDLAGAEALGEQLIHFDDVPL
ncbi:MAG: hypothetical protein KHX37_09720 [Eubacterium sp.]|nr:hypothetical protein [Eubacterium sp.]